MVSSKATTKALPFVAHSQRWVLCIHRLNYFFNNLMEHTLYAWFSQEELRHLLQSQGYYYTLQQDFQSGLCDLYICALIHQATQIPNPCQLLLTTRTSKNYYIFMWLFWVKLNHVKDFKKMVYLTDWHMVPRKIILLLWLLKAFSKHMTVQKRQEIAMLGQFSGSNTRFRICLCVCVHKHQITHQEELWCYLDGHLHVINSRSSFGASRTSSSFWSHDGGKTVVISGPGSWSWTGDQLHLDLI